MAREITLTSAYTGFLLAVLGVIAWATGQPFVFPSLGPTAYLLSRDRRFDLLVTRRVVGGHTFGVLAGLLAYHLLAAGVVVNTTVPAFSLDLLRLSLAAVVSITLTATAMIATDTSHPPACATTLIISLGLLSTVAEGAIIVVAVVVLVGLHELILLAASRTSLGVIDRDR